MMFFKFALHRAGGGEVKKLSIKKKKLKGYTRKRGRSGQRRKRDFRNRKQGGGAIPWNGELDQLGAGGGATSPVRRALGDFRKNSSQKRIGHGFPY